ncbi:MAG: hypothetical protein ACOH5I_15805 [Oligoflexus sp.]
MKNAIKTEKGTLPVSGCQETEWIDSSQNLFGNPAFKHTLTKELVCFGSKGQAFDAGDGLITVILYLNSGTEQLAKYPLSRKVEVFKRAGIPRTLMGQRAYIV